MQKQEKAQIESQQMSPAELALLSNLILQVQANINSQISAMNESGAEPVALIEEIRIVDKLAKAGTAVVCLVDVTFENGWKEQKVLKMSDSSLFSDLQLESFGDMLDREIKIYRTVSQFPGLSNFPSVFAADYSEPKGLNFILMDFIDARGTSLSQSERMLRLARKHDEINQYGIYNYDGSLNNVLNSQEGQDVQDYWIDLAGFVLPPELAPKEFELHYPRAFCDYVPMAKVRPSYERAIDASFKTKMTRVLLLTLFVVEILKMPTRLESFYKILELQLSGDVTSSSPQEMVDSYWRELEAKKGITRVVIPESQLKMTDEILAMLSGIKPIPEVSNEKLISDLLKYKKSLNNPL